MEMGIDNYLEYMRALRSQVNDAEDDAAKLAAQDQMLITEIGNNENDLQSVKSEMRIFEDKIGVMEKEKCQVCSRMIEKKKKNASLASDSCTLIQALELIQQDSVNLLAKCQSNRTDYAKLSEDLNATLQEKQDWFNSHMKDAEGHKLVEDIVDEQMPQTGGKASQTSHQTRECLKKKIELVKEKLGNLGELKSKLAMEIIKMKESAERVHSQFDNFNSELRGLGVEILEEEHEAIVSDKDGESGFLHSLQEQIEYFKGFSEMIKCDCGEEYKVEAHEN